jgi:hypothetical protein
MAINIISNPNSVVSAFNQMAFNVSSTQAGQSNFNFIADVYVSGITNAVSRIAIPKQPSVNTCLIDVSPILKNYVKNDFFNVNNSFASTEPNLNSRVKYYVQFGELYDVSGVPTIYPDLRRFPTSGSNTAVNSIFDFEDFNTNVWNGYDVSGFGFLTEIPERITIEQGQELHLSFYDPSNLIRYLYVDGIYGFLIDANKVSGEFLYNVNIKNLLGQDESYQTIGTHTITLANSFVAPVKIITIEIVAKCSKFDTIRLHWLNNLGGWDSYNFTKQSLKSMDIDRKQFKKMQSINYSKSDRLKTNYNTTITDKLQINSDWISDEMADWFQGLLTSPIVYLERGAENFVSVNITNSNYLIQQYLNARKLHNLQLEIEYSYNRYTQSQ